MHFLFLPALWLGCAHTPSATPKVAMAPSRPAPPAAPALPDPEPYLAPNTWEFRCPDCRFGDSRQFQARFHDDGTISRHYPSVNRWSHNADSRWWFDDNELIIEWNGGFAIARYRIGAPDAEWPGRHSNLHHTVYVRQVTPAHRPGVIASDAP